MSKALSIVSVILSCGAIYAGFIQSQRSSSQYTELLMLKFDSDLVKQKVDRLESNKGTNSFNNTYAEFEPDSEGYIPVNANVGTVFIMLDKLEKYANGYKVSFLIGNPLVTTFTETSLNVSYGPKESVTSSTGNEPKLKNKDFKILDQILSGRWNRVTVTLSPASDKDIEYIKVFPLFDKMTLAR